MAALTAPSTSMLVPASSGMSVQVLSPEVRVIGLFRAWSTRLGDGGDRFVFRLASEVDAGHADAGVHFVVVDRRVD